jgi:3-deoxy-D-manno-octulosonate 8-phosphate phosphatase (KDO 8-P phosphatase)
LNTSGKRSRRLERAPGAKRWPRLDAIRAVGFDFDGVFTDNKVWIGQDGAEWVRCDRGDGLAIRMLQAAIARGLMRAEVFILSRERNPVTEARARKIGLECHSGCDDKLAFVEARLRAAEAGFAQLVYVGNDLNDLPVMTRAGFSVAPADAHDRVRQIASVVLPQRGGEGFVRAFVEHLLGVDRMSTEKVNELVHHR